MLKNLFQGDQGDKNFFEGGRNFAQLLTFCRPVVENLAEKLPNKEFKPNIDELVRPNEICKTNFDMSLRETLVVVVNGLLRVSNDLSLFILTHSMYILQHMELQTG